MKTFSLPRLQSGGLIVTYRCTSRCRHCLCASSPRREARYIDAETARRAFAAVRRLGCPSVHVGGGEPFLDPSGLLAAARAAGEEGVTIEYVETNSSWYRSSEAAVPLLRDLQAAGVATLLVSISPFHTEYIPLSRVRGLMEACDESGMSVFPWIESFLPELSSLDESTTHSIEERGGDEYMRGLPSRYWIHWGGRAVSSFRPLLPCVAPERLRDAGAGCAELSDTSHFHVDLEGNYVPGLCSGIAIDMNDLDRPLAQNCYPLITRLASEGVAGLVDWARDRHAFEPRDAYLNKCDLCLHVRGFLSRLTDAAFPELAPREFYRELSPALPSP